VTAPSPVLGASCARILADTRQRLAQRRAELPEAALERVVLDALADAATPTLDLAQALRAPGVSIIAEIKRASPSRGGINPGLDPEALACAYAAAGADALSVLTEPVHFGGSAEDLQRARRATEERGLRRPVLRKDFILSRYQLLEARAWGADAALLIVAALDDATLRALHREALSLSLTPLVEVHDEAELQRALALERPLVGINNRDLRDFRVDLETTARLRELVPDGCCVVSESGIREPEQMRRLAAWGVDAALIGEALVSAPDPAVKLAALKEAGR
jgi:indole-3-glycerol phosphate synthase